MLASSKAHVSTYMTSLYLFASHPPAIVCSLQAMVPW